MLNRQRLPQRQLIFLFLANMGRFMIGALIMPHLPVYASRLGADPAQTGILLGVAFAALAAGTMSAGSLINRFQRRKAILVAAASLSIPTSLGLLLAQDLTQLTLMIGVDWFMAGISLSTLNILAGAFAKPEQRGRIFGILGMSTGLAQFIGGLAGGWIVDHISYESLFISVVLVNFAFLLTVLNLRDVRVNAATSPQKRIAFEPETGLHVEAFDESVSPLWRSGFVMLALAAVVANVVSFSGALARPLAMDTLGYSATAIAGAAALGGLFSIPMPMLLGVLSDRFGRRVMLGAAYIIVSLSALVVAGASEVWQFALASVMATFILAGSQIGTALVMDITDEAYVSAAISRYGSMGWVGAVIGLTGSGYLIRGLSIPVALPWISLLGVFALVLVVGAGGLGTKEKPRATQEVPASAA